jgi:RHS repeat-associated protein
MPSARCASSPTLRAASRRPAGASWNRLKFAGKERDTETGALSDGADGALDYFSARYYQNQTGRFTSVDPGHVNGNILDPQSWNGYAYARNNPLKYTDPTGTTFEICADGVQCQHVSDQYFAILQRNPGPGIRLTDGKIVAGGVTVGSYQQTSVDATWGTFAASMGRYTNAIAPFVNAGAAVTGAIVTGGTLWGVAGGVAVQEFLLPMGGTIAAGMSAVQNPALQKALNEIYRYKDRIAGGTAGAARFTQMTGELVGNSDHVGKVVNSIGRLERILREQPLSASDRALAQAVLTRLRAAVP